MSRIPLLALLLCGSAQAALPPSAASLRDLDVLVDFVRRHPEVAASVQALDLKRAMVLWGEGCEAHFERARIFHPPGWTGPQPPLQLARTTCALDEPELEGTLR